jgi:hypothetical protein
MSAAKLTNGFRRRDAPAATPYRKDVAIGLSLYKKEHGGVQRSPGLTRSQSPWLVSQTSSGAVHEGNSWIPKRISAKLPFSKRHIATAHSAAQGSRIIQSAFRRHDLVPRSPDHGIAGVTEHSSYLTTVRLCPNDTTITVFFCAISR